MKKFKEEILKLREQGLTYKQIQEKLNCSKGTISFHCGDKQKEKTTIRYNKNKTSIKYKVSQKIDTFLARNKDNLILYNKRDQNHKEFLQKIISNPFCYLTGKQIDLEDASSYCLDHIIPYYISKDNSINNMKLIRSEVNASKAHLTIQEYLNLCKEVLEYSGYKVIKTG